MKTDMYVYYGFCRYHYGAPPLLALQQHASGHKLVLLPQGFAIVHKGWPLGSTMVLQ